MGNSLFQNSGDGTFRSRGATAGIEMGRWAWSSDAWDFDHDGFPDLYVTNGMVSGTSREDLNSFFWRQVVANSPAEPQLAHNYEQGWNALNELIRSDGTWSGFERNVFYANNRDGTFSDVSGVVGLDFVEDGRSFALADFDHDGRVEVFLKNRNGPQLRLLKNVMPELPPSIAFRLRGTKSNCDAIGAAVTIETSLGRQTRMLQAGSGFLSQHSKEVWFGLGESKGVVKGSIRWPSGLVQELHNLPPSHRVWVEEGSEAVRLDAFKNSNLELKPTAEQNAIHREEAEQFPDKAETWLLAPVSAPDFSLLDLAGNPHTLKTFQDKLLLVYFWVAQSAACREDLKTLDRSYKRWAGQGLQVLTVNFDIPDSARLRAVARDLGLTFPILRGSDETAGVYNILYRYLFDRHRDIGFPTSFLIDAAGQIVKLYQGPVNPSNIEKDYRRIPQTAADRLALALPFSGVSADLGIRRNYLTYGSIYFQRGYYDQSEASFRLALADDPASAEAFYGLGSANLKLEKYTEARENFERATKLTPSYPDTLANSWNNLGLLATREGHTDEGIENFQKALKLNPNHLIALENLGNAYRQQKNWGEARKIFDRALANNPDDPEANYGLGMVFAQLDDSERAHEYLQKALKARPGYPEALNNLGVLYLRTRRRNEAVASFEECIRDAPAFDQSYLNLARVYALEGTPNKARSVLLELLRQHPDHAQAKAMIEQLPK